MTPDVPARPATFVNEVTPMPRRARPKEEGMKGVTCPECAKTFETPRQLGPHRNKAHGYRRGKGKAVRKKTAQRDEPKVRKPRRKSSLLADLISRLEAKKAEIEATLATLRAAEQLL